jgi:intein/homing endonuclease
MIATEGHPFWVDDQGRWINAGDLEPGDVLLLSGMSIPGPVRGALGLWLAV